MALAEQIIEQRLRAAGSKKRAVLNRKPLRMTEPRALEAEASRILRNVVVVVANAIRRNIVPRLQSLSLDQKMLNSLTDSTRHDVTITERVVALFLATRAQAGVELTESQVLEQLGTTAVAIESFNARQLNRVFQDIAGVDLFGDEPFIAEELARYNRQNIRLIRNVQEEFLSGAEETVLRGLRRGTRHEVIAQQLLGQVTDPEGFRGRFRKAETRAKLIARDQVNKLNGRLTELRQESAGIKQYIWRTSLDERVRPEHRAREGRKYSWTKPPFDGHPGEPIQCRCFAEPVFTDKG